MTEDIRNMEIRGRDLLTGLPKTIEITAEEIAEALHDTVLCNCGISKKYIRKNSTRTWR